MELGKSGDWAEKSLEQKTEVGKHVASKKSKSLDRAKSSGSVAWQKIRSLEKKNIAWKINRAWKSKPNLEI